MLFRIRYSLSLIGEMISFLTPRPASARARPSNWLRNAYISRCSTIGNSGNTCIGPRKKCAVSFSMIAASYQALPPPAFMPGGSITSSFRQVLGRQNTLVKPSWVLSSLRSTRLAATMHITTAQSRRGRNSTCPGSGREDGLRRPCFRFCRRTGSRCYRDGCKFYTRRGVSHHGFEFSPSSDFCRM
jgi:hypothetical protein